MRIRRLAALLVMLLSIVWIFPDQIQAATKPSLSAASAVLIDAQSGRVLFSKDASTKRPMASLTKIMTCALALEYGKLDELSITSPEAAFLEPCEIGLTAGEQMSLQDLIYGTMLESGNDSALAIAEHIGGSQENFARLMTDRASAIGAKNTSFKNPHGLDQAGHYTTAYDLALISRYAMSVPGFAEVVATSKRVISGPRTVYNQNQMLNKVVGGDGIKIGFTDNAGRCLAASATRNGHRLIAVVLNAPNWWNDCAALLNYGFDLVHFYPVVEKNELIKTISVRGGVAQHLTLAAAGDFYLPLIGEEEKQVTTYWHVPETVVAPIKQGQIIGELAIHLQDQQLGSVPLIATQSIGRQLTWWERIWAWLGLGGADDD